MEYRLEEKFHNNLNTAEKPAGGLVRMPGVEIDWRSEDPTKFGPKDSHNGRNADVEDVIRAAKQRLEFYRDTPDVPCYEYIQAIEKLTEALFWLKHREERA